MSNSLALRFLDYLDNHKPEQIVEDVIYEYFKKEFQQLPSVINELSKTGQLKISQIGDKLAYGVVSSIEMERNKGLNPEHKMLLQHIEEAGDLGIWTRDLKQNTKLSQQVMTKALKLLETRKLVKSVKSISSKTKKLYMLYDTIPSVEITGGPWYSGQEFDHSFIEMLSKFVFEVIKANSMASIEFITNKVKTSGISNVTLGTAEIMSIVKLLMYDNKIEEVSMLKNQMKSKDGKKYKVSTVVTSFNHLTSTPCGVCPVFNQCEEGNIISPATCIYMTKWLNITDADAF